MKYPNRRGILAALSVLACALPTVAQTYTDEQITTNVCNLPYTWNMLAEEYSFQPYCSAFPSGFNRFNIIGTGAFIHADRSSVNGKSLSASTLYRLHTVDQSDRRFFGGEYNFWCYGTRCDVDMNRGPTVPEAHSRNYYQSADFDNTALRRVFAVTEYINTGVSPVAKNSNDYYFPIGPWDMTTSHDFPVNRFTVPLPGLEINRIANVSVLILSNMTSDGKVKADHFDRRGVLGAAGEPYPYLLRGGVFDVKQSANGSDCQVDLSLYNTEPYWRTGNPANAFSGPEYKGGAANRGWIKVTYFGSVPGLLQPVAIKTLAKPIGPWRISTRENSGERYRSFPFGVLGVAGNRLTSSDVTIHRDDGGGVHAVGPLKRTPYNGLPSGGSASSTFTIDETKDRFTMFATYKHMGDASEGYYSQNHYAGAPYNRGWYRIDYLAGTCATAATGYSIKGIPSATNGTCGGGSGTNTTVEGAGKDIWGGSDEFTFMYKKFTAGENKTFTARIASQANTEGWAKAGLMFRANLNANSPHASTLMTPSFGAHFNWRTSAGGSTARWPADNGRNAMAPYWLRIKKVGTTFTAEFSSNGTNFSPLGSPQNIAAFGSTFYVGFAVSSRTSGMSKAVFTNVSGI